MQKEKSFPMIEAKGVLKSSLMSSIQKHNASLLPKKVTKSQENSVKKQDS